MRSSLEAGRTKRVHGRLILACVALACLTACAPGTDEGVQELRDGSWHDLGMTLASVTGHRDGETTHAMVRFEGAAGSLELKLEVVVSPQAKLRSGWWRRQTGDRVETGSAVRARSLRFLGGQGTNASVGGRFTLLDDTGERWRVEFAPTVLKGRGER